MRRHIRSRVQPSMVLPLRDILRHSIRYTNYCSGQVARGCKYGQILEFSSLAMKGCSGQVGQVGERAKWDGQGK